MLENNKKAERKTTVVPALEKALDIIEYIAHKGTYMTAKTIANNLGIPPATTYRTINYLCSRGYLQEDVQAEGRYYLGTQLLHLANLMSHQMDLVQIAKPIMQELASKTGQTAQLGILQDDHVIYVDQVLPITPVNIIAALRTPIPLNLSASGKVLAASLDASLQDAILQRVSFPQQTPNSISQIDEFKRELESVRENGYALDNEEYARGIGCTAAPIYNHRGQVVAAVGITGHIADYLDHENRQQLVLQVTLAAQQISRLIGEI